MFDGGVVDAEDPLIVQRADDHRNRVAVEQQPERGLALLQFGDVDAQPDTTAVLGQPLLDQDAAAVGKNLLVTFAGLPEPGDPFGDPFFLAADRLGVIAALDADADGVLQARTRLEKVGAAAVDLGVFLVPENIAAVGIEKHDALRQNIDRLAQSLMRFARFRDRSLGLGAHAGDFAVVDSKTETDIGFQFRNGPGRPNANTAHGRVLRLPVCPFGRIRPLPWHCCASLAFCVAMFSDKCLKKWYLVRLRRIGAGVPSACLEGEFAFRGAITAAAAGDLRMRRAKSAVL